MRAPALLLPALLWMGTLLLIPVGHALWSSLHVITPFEQRFVGLENYADLFADRTARGTLTFTLLFVAVSTVLEVLIGLGLALVLDASFRGRSLVRALVLVPWAIPTVVAAVIWQHIFNDRYGLVNLLLHGADTGSYQAWLSHPGTARLAIIVADVWKTSGFAAIVILAGLQSIPVELHEAARLEGAGRMRRFVSITLPLLRPALLVALLFRVIDAFRVFDLVYVMTHGAPGDSTSVLSFYAYTCMFPEQRFGYGSTLSVAIFLMSLAVAGLLVWWLPVRRRPT